MIESVRNRPESFVLHMQQSTGNRRVSDFLERRLAVITDREPELMAFATLNTTHSRAAAWEADERWNSGTQLSAIDGMPIGVKDIISTRDMPTKMGTPHDWTGTPPVDAACVKAVRAAGAILLGKMTTTEFAIGGTSTATRNPWHPEHTPGGSSSGSAAAAGANMVSAAFGTQTQGSIIRPAAFCGAVGYKPTHGLFSTQGVHPLSFTLDHLGALGGTLEDVWEMMRVVGTKAPWPGVSRSLGDLPLIAQKPKRVGVLATSGLTELNPESRQRFDTLLNNLNLQGVEVVTREDDPALDALCGQLEWAPELSMALISHEAQWPYGEYNLSKRHALDQRILGLLEQGASRSADTIDDIYADRLALKHQAENFLATVDAVVLPAGSGPAPAGLENSGSRTNLVYATLMGLPAFALPLMTVNKMPFGLQLVGAPGEDEALAGMAHWLIERKEAFE